MELPQMRMRSIYIYVGSTDAPRGAGGVIETVYGLVPGVKQCLNVGTKMPDWTALILWT